jgi:uncharacterized protein YndB with AHSA1/START domain
MSASPRTKRRGRDKLHFLNPVPINAIAERWMTRYDRARASALADLKHALEHQSMENSFVYTTYINAAPERLWTALTDPAFTRRYWGVSLVSDWSVGSTVTWQLDRVTIADDESVVLVSDPPRRLSFTWHTVTPAFNAAYGDDQGRARRNLRRLATHHCQPQDTVGDGRTARRRVTSHVKASGVQTCGD